MRVHIKFFGDLRRYGEDGMATIDLDDENANISSIIHAINKPDALAKELFENGVLKKYFIILVNGQRIDLLDGIDTVVSEGDKVSIFPPVAGG